MNEQESSICIIGLGLMGGSLALAWRRAGWPARIVGVDRDVSALQAAEQAGAIDAGTQELGPAVAGADVVVLATPVRAILRLLPEVGRQARDGALVLDLGSSKRQVCSAMARLPAGLQPIGGHPMCGKEVAGFAAAAADLFRGRAFVLCPLERTSAATLERAERMVRATGANPLVLDPAGHDAAVAAISHLPYTAAVALVRAVAAAGDPLPWQLASSGFRDTSRLAASDVEMMLDILTTNRDAILPWMDAMAAELAALRAALSTSDEPRLRTLLDGARLQRENWHP